MTRDQYLTEKVLGECWHEFLGPIKHSCKNHLFCGCHDPRTPNNNFSSAEGFFKLWNFCKKQEWWWAFIDSFYFIDATNGDKAIIHHIHPDRFADAVYNFHRKEFPDDHLRIDNKQTGKPRRNHNV